MEYSDRKDSMIDTLVNALSMSPEGAVLSDMRRKDQPIIYCNQTFLEMSGYDKEEVVGRNCRFLQGNDDRQAELDDLRAAINAQRPCKVVLRNYRKNGELFFNRLSISPIFNEKRELTHFMGIQDDVSDFISMQDQLHKTEEDNKALLAEVHHRVKNNLSVMSSLLELENNQNNESDALEKSRLRVHSMSLIHELLYQKEGLACIELSSLIKELASHKYHSAAGTMAKLHFSFEMKPAELNINQAVPLSIIISELFHNAARHAYPGAQEGDVDVSLTAIDEHNLQLEILDYGIGMKDPASFKKPETMGFTVVKTLISQIKGDAQIISDNTIGFGVRFRIPNLNKSGLSQSRRIPSLASV